jgi:hypothetical protein
MEGKGESMPWSFHEAIFYLLMPNFLSALMLSGRNTMNVPRYYANQPVSKIISKLDSENCILVLIEALPRSRGFEGNQKATDIEC